MNFCPTQICRAVPPNHPTPPLGGGWWGRAKAPHLHNLAQPKVFQVGQALRHLADGNEFLGFSSHGALPLDNAQSAVLDPRLEDC